MFVNKKFVLNQSNRTSFLEVNPKNLNSFESISASNTPASNTPAPKNLPKSGYTHNHFLATLDFFGNSHSCRNFGKNLLKKEPR
ncbi:hypothetical protein CJJ18_02195 [Candidatus Williamhamiltonella defendens]|uniref:Uncharacterized protein n=1 Tax=Candidatus Williamhamiltonella defendens TaxID=138072 RepID=A0AAC9YEY4_9ENTR|nr:hypothetical protein CJJ18_02195 [Candidatus Hamiltonella defensa]AWK16055.1 hypothetical protein CCS40_02210 [Candidatus Hamiltonella defensa]